MRPSRYFPEKNSLDDLMRSLVYLLERMTEREATSINGLAFMANMADWGYSNFSVNYCKNFLDTMQGRYPCRIRLFLIVNPPSWFSIIWRIMRTMMSKQFAEKVFLPKGNELFNFVDAENVPKEFGGTLDLDEALQSFIKYRYKVEGIEYTERAINYTAPVMMSAEKVEIEQD